MSYILLPVSSLSERNGVMISAYLGREYGNLCPIIAHCDNDNNFKMR